MFDLEVIYEDNHLIAVNKKSGDIVHGDKTGDKTLEEAVKKYIKYRYKKPGDVYLGVLHRIDRPVSGVVIFARTSKAAERMSALIQNNGIERTYYALSVDRPEPMSGTLEHYLIKNLENNTVKAYDNPKPEAKKAVLHYEIAGQIGKNTLIKVRPVTGRSHQIRVQLKKLGCIINGDMKYGCTFGYPDYSIALHHFSSSFIHPVTKEKITITADPPKTQVWREFERLIL